jgi:hypothetical protein
MMPAASPADSAGGRNQLEWQRRQQLLKDSIRKVLFCLECHCSSFPKIEI